MPNFTAGQFLDREFLHMRSRVLDLAAALDRIERAAEWPAAAGDPRLAKLKEGIAMLIDDRGDRAKRVQMTFSDPYDTAWRRQCEG